MSVRSVLLVVAIVGAALAGCLSPPSAPPSGPTQAQLLAPDWFEAALAHDEAHNHSDIMQHQNASTPNFKLLGHDWLKTEHYEGEPAYGYGCGGWAARADGRVLSVVNAFQDDLAFVLVDVTDPTAPVKVGEFYAKGIGSYDADLTPDGMYVALAFDDLARPPAPGALASLDVALPTFGFRNLCDGSERVFEIPLEAVVSAGILLFDVSDPADPVFVDWDPTPGRNLHSVSTAGVGGANWVIGSVLGGAPRPPGSPVSTGVHQMSYFAFDEIQDTPLGTKLVRRATYPISPATMGGEAGVTVPIRNGHTDVVMMEHPGTGTLYAYIAAWEGGVLIVDMSDPATPTLVGQWTPPHPTTPYPNGDGPCYRSAVHGVVPAPELWDERHYIFAGQECPTKADEEGPGGSVFVLDATDPANIEQVGEWHPPAETGIWTIVYQASPHYMAIVNRTMFVTLYHGGLWAVDLSTPEALATTPSVGVYLPSLVPDPMPEGEHTMPVDEQVDALPDGTLALVEGTTGLYLLRFDASDPAPPAVPYPYG